MLSQAERSVYEKYRDEPVFIAGAVLKCGVMLAFLALLVWIAVDSPDQAAELNRYPTAVAERQPVPENASARHRKVIFDERRSRWEVRAQQTAKAGTTASR